MPDLPEDPLDRLAGEQDLDGGRGSFRTHLEACDELLLAAAQEVADRLPDLARGLLRGDAQALVRGEAIAARVNARCIEVEDRCLVMIAREAPVGRDLRRIVAMLRLAPRVHRSVQLARHIPEALPALDPIALPPAIRELLEELVTAAAGVFASGVDAWRRRDGLAVIDVARADEQVDALRERLVDHVIAAGLPGEVNMAVGLLGRYLERIGDHGVAFARDAAFAVTGQRITGTPR